MSRMPLASRDVPEREHVSSSAWGRLWSRLAIAYRIFRIHPTMPATAFWRIYEAEIALRRLRGQGRGLDLGCGDGSFASVLFASLPGIHWIGLEKDEMDAELARRSIHYEEVRVCRGEEMPFEDSSFDVVFSNCVLEHVEGLDDVLAHVGRVLKPGGQFVFTVPTEDFHEALYIARALRFLGLFRLADRYVRHLDERLEMVNLLSSQQWRQKLSRSGMQFRYEAPYAARWAAAWWELLATATGGVTYWMARGQWPLRRLQQSTGMLDRERPWLGTIFFVLLLPIIVITALQPTAGLCAGRYVEAVKEGTPR